MPWHPDSPVGNISVRANGPPMRENTTYILNSQRVNHYFDEANVGKHRMVTMPVLAASPISVGGDLILFTKNENSAALYMVRDGVPATETILSTAFIAKPTSAINGISWLAGDALVGGIFIQWGQKLSPGNSGHVAFNKAFKVGSIPFTIQLTLERDNADATVCIKELTPDNSGFDYRSSSSNAAKLHWLAIGLAG
jgi:hypothetical protein